MRFWDDVSVGSVYTRLRILTVIVGIPGMVAFLQLISLDSCKVFLVFGAESTFPPLTLLVSPLEVLIRLGYHVPTGDPYVLLLSAVFLVSFAGAMSLIWCMFLVRAAMYTPGYNTFADVKKAARSLLPGTEEDRRMIPREDQRMLALYALAMAAGYVGTAIGFGYHRKDDLQP